MNLTFTHPNVEGRNIAVVTGASKGVGRGIALALAEAGFDVAVNYRGDPKGAELAAEKIRAIGRNALVVQADVGFKPEVDRMFDVVLESWERPRCWSTTRESRHGNLFWIWPKMSGIGCSAPISKGPSSVPTEPPGIWPSQTPGPDHQYRLGLQQGAFPQPCRLHEQQRWDRDVYARGGRGIGLLRNHGELRSSRHDRN